MSIEFRDAGKGIRHMGLREKLKLMAISQRSLYDDVHAVLGALIDGGITAWMLREKDMDPDDLLAQAEIMSRQCREQGILFIINKHVALAAAVGADGVHLGFDAPSVAETRARYPKLVIGVSAHSIKDVEGAISEGADYATVSPIYPTLSKVSMGVVGIDGLKEICTRFDFPIIALGGITTYNAQFCLEAGACGVAAIGSLCGVSKPREAAARFFPVQD